MPQQKPLLAQLRARFVESQQGGCSCWDSVLSSGGGPICSVIKLWKRHESRVCNETESVSAYVMCFLYLCPGCHIGLHGGALCLIEEASTPAPLLTRETCAGLLVAPAVFACGL